MTQLQVTLKLCHLNRGRVNIKVASFLDLQQLEFELVAFVGHFAGHGLPLRSSECEGGV